MLRGAFADAAFSRWRTLHKIPVIAIVLGDHGEYLVICYLDHDLVEAQRGAEVYQRCHPKDAAKRTSVAALKQTLADFNEVVAKYGPAFKSPYGWAAEALRLRRNRPSSIWSRPPIRHRCGCSTRSPVMAFMRERKA